jgi:hypothetical protein
MHNLAHIISGSSKHLTNEITYHKEKTDKMHPVVQKRFISESIVGSNTGQLDEQYILPHSSTEYLNESDVKGFTYDELQLARNEIFARHGYVFKMQVFDEYFSQKSWYEKRENFSSDDLNKFESYNVTFLKEEEGRR